MGIVLHSSRGWGKSRQTRAAYEEAKARGDHAHLWSTAGGECSISCGEHVNLIRYPRPNRLGLSPKESSELG